MKPGNRNFPIKSIGRGEQAIVHKKHSNKNTLLRGFWLRVFNEIASPPGHYGRVEAEARTQQKSNKNGSERAGSEGGRGRTAAVFRLGMTATCVFIIFFTLIHLVVVLLRGLYINQLTPSVVTEKLLHCCARSPCLLEIGGFLQADTELMGWTPL